MIDAFRMISDNLGKKTMFISVPLWAGVYLAICLKYITFRKIDYVERVQRMGENRCFAHQAAKEDFNFTPEPFKLGIVREVKEYLNRYQNR